MLSGEYDKTQLENGITVITERWPHVRSASLGVWVRIGTRDEGNDQHGISHFVEHAVFKGTERRSAFDIVHSLESLGGSLDAFTSRDVTCYYARCLDEHWLVALDVISDLVQRPRLAPDDLEKERRVILEEIQSVEDTPEDLIHDLFAQSVWGRHPVGAPILGTPESVRGFTRDQVASFIAQHYVPSAYVVSAAGNVVHEEIVEGVRRLFDKPGPPHAVDRRLRPEPAVHAVRHYNRDIGQMHFCLGTTAYAYAHPRQYDLLVANDVLGGGMTSRLFQEVRERKALAYNVYSYTESLEDTGIFGTYMACDRSRADEAIDIVRRELERLKAEGITEEEMEGAKAQLRGELILGFESMNGRMSNIANDEIYLGRYSSPAEALSLIEGVTQEGVFEACQSLLDDDRMHQVTVGP